MDTLMKILFNKKDMPPFSTHVQNHKVQGQEGSQVPVPLGSSCASASQEHLVTGTKNDENEPTTGAPSPYRKTQQLVYPYGTYYSPICYAQAQPHQVVPIEKPDPGLQQFYNRRTWRPIFTYITSLAMIAMMIYGLVKNRQVTGHVIELSPFNIMIGPSAEVLILSGGRYVPCMRPTRSPLSPTDTFQCPNMTDFGQTSATAPSFRPIITGPLIKGPPCSLEDTCGMWPFKYTLVPDQWYRFFTAIFSHAGILHIIGNLSIHLTLGRSMEKIMNPLRYGFVWIASGVFGFIFGGVFAPLGNTSVGCSGALFGVGGLLFIDLFQSWRYIKSPGWELVKLIVLMVFCFILGLLPGNDNFSQMGGFVCGLLSGVMFLPAIRFSRKYMVFLWIVRILTFAILVALFYVLLDRFYHGQDPEEVCSWCKYLACLPIASMCEPYQAS